MGKKHTLESREKISKSLKGRTVWNKGIPYLKIRGVNHHNWKGGISKKNHVIRTSIEYKNWRREVFERDNYTCQKCNTKGCYLEADHIKPFAKYPELRFDLDNGRTVCKPCHNIITWGGKNDFNFAFDNGY